jgi:hypothetical protein
MEGTLSAAFQQEMINPNAAQQHLDDHINEELGRKRCTLSFQVPFVPAAVEAISSQTSPGTADNATIRILSTIMGGISQDIGSAVVSGASATAFTITTGHGTNFAIGGAMGLFPDSASTFEVREIKQVSTDTLTLPLALSTTPAAADVVYRATTLYLDETPSVTSLQFVLEGAEYDDYWRLSGMQGGFTLNLPNGEMPTVTFNLTGTLHANLGSRGSAIAAATYSNFEPIAIVDSDLRIHNPGTTTLGSAVPASSIEVTPQITYAEIATPSSQGIKEWRRIRNPEGAVRCSVTIPYESTAYFTDRDNKQGKAIRYQLGNSAGGSLLISVPDMQILDVQLADANNIRSQVISGKGRHDADITGTATAMSRSALRIHYV